MQRAEAPQVVKGLTGRKTTGGGEKQKNNRCSPEKQTWGSWELAVKKRPLQNGESQLSHLAPMGEQIFQALECYD